MSFIVNKLNPERIGGIWEILPKVCFADLRAASGSYERFRCVRPAFLLLPRAWWTVFTNESWWEWRSCGVKRQYGCPGALWSSAGEGTGLSNACSQKPWVAFRMQMLVLMGAKPITSTSKYLLVYERGQGACILGPVRPFSILIVQVVLFSCCR